MSYSVYDDEIVIKSKRNKPILAIVGAIFLALLVSLLIFWAGKIIMNGKQTVAGIITLICAPFFVLKSIFYAFSYKDRISVSTDSISCSLLDIEEEVQFNNISKAMISDDKCLILYDKTNDVDTPIDLELFENKEIQLLINAICKKIPLTIDANIMQETGLKLPEYAITKASSTSRRRNVSSDKSEKNTIIESKETTRKRDIASNRRLELSDNKQTKEKANNKRRLEL